MSTLSTNTISNLSGSKSATVDNILEARSRAWVNFKGQGTVAIRDSFNVSSITDNGTGDYTVNFANAMPNANYAIGQSFSGNFGTSSPGGVSLFAAAGAGSTTTPTTTAFRFACYGGGTTAVYDPLYVTLIVAGD